MFPTSFAAIPPGALDLTGEAVRRRRSLQRAAMDTLEHAGYEELLPPTFEYEDTFIRAGGPGVAERLVRFPDRDGRILALRYDFTASLARVAATTFADASGPLRLCYSGKVYRQESERGADVEIVRITLGLLGAAGVRDFQLNLGHVGVLAAGLDAIEEPLRADVRRWIDRKDQGSLRRALASLSGDACTLMTLPFVIGRRDALEEAARNAPHASRAGLEHLLALDSALTANERTHLVYDLGEVRGLDYYTGIHFELYVSGAGRAAGAGGRYDDLMGRFGRPMPAVGVSLDLDTIAEVAV